MTLGVEMLLLLVVSSSSNQKLEEEIEKKDPLDWVLKQNGVANPPLKGRKVVLNIKKVLSLLPLGNLVGEKGCLKLLRMIHLTP